MRHESRRHDEVERSVARALIGDADVAALRVPGRLRLCHGDWAGRGPRECARRCGFNVRRVRRSDRRLSILVIRHGCRLSRHCVCTRDVSTDKPFLSSGSSARGRIAYYRFGAMPYRMVSDAAPTAENASGRRRARRLTTGTEIATIASFVGGVPERSKGTDCKSVGSAFEGSNPSPSTTPGNGGQGAENRRSPPRGAPWE